MNIGVGHEFALRVCTYWREVREFLRRGEICDTRLHFRARIRPVLLHQFELSAPIGAANVSRGCELSRFLIFIRAVSNLGGAKFLLSRGSEGFSPSLAMSYRGPYWSIDSHLTMCLALSPCMGINSLLRCCAVRPREIEHMESSQVRVLYSFRGKAGGPGIFARAWGSCRVTDVTVLIGNASSAIS